ncbi:hypothetical protein AKJ09_07579 [Labilithrix luteola]|uniref:Uncharacterized protein n=1 Tax=Labilithrix luteola TaxID=1391654 RepID=A0A0K1Q501_9BACT|nr:hypothetical protein [Labilithrix luteola]AKV00916.1 hypothetical protein AKJ09_07579 [Labilithrix luteola]
MGVLSEDSSSEIRVDVDDADDTTSAQLGPPVLSDDEELEETATATKRPAIANALPKLGDTEDDVTATAPRGNLPPSFLFVPPARVEIRDAPQREEELLDETEVKTVPGEISAILAAAARAPAPKPAAGSRPQPSPPPDPLPADQEPDSITAMAPKRSEAIAALMAGAIEDDTASAIREARTTVGGRPHPAQKAASNAPDAYDAEESITTRGPPVDLDDDSITSLGPPLARNNPPLAGRISPLDRAIALPESERPARMPGTEDDSVVTAEAPAPLTNMLRVIASDRISKGDEEEEISRTSVMSDAPFRRVLDASASASVAAVAPHPHHVIGGGASMGGLAVAATLHAGLPASDSGLRVAQSPQSGSGERNLAGSLASSAAAAIPRDAPSGSPSDSFSGSGAREPSLHDVDFRGPRYGLIVAVVASVSVLVPVTLFFMLHSSPEDTPDVRRAVATQPAADLVKRDEGVRGRDRSKASPSASPSASPPPSPPPSTGAHRRFPFRR